MCREGGVKSTVRGDSSGTSTRGMSAGITASMLAHTPIRIVGCAPIRSPRGGRRPWPPTDDVDRGDRAPLQPVRSDGLADGGSVAVVGRQEDTMEQTPDHDGRERRHAHWRCRWSLLRHDRGGTPLSRVTNSLTDMPSPMPPRGPCPASQQTLPADAAVAFSSRSTVSRSTFCRFVYRTHPLPTRAPTNSARCASTASDFIP